MTPDTRKATYSLKEISAATGISYTVLRNRVNRYRSRGEPIRFDKNRRCGYDDVVRLMRDMRKEKSPKPRTEAIGALRTALSNDGYNVK